MKLLRILIPNTNDSRADEACSDSSVVRAEMGRNGPTVVRDRASTRSCSNLISLMLDIWTSFDYSLLRRSYSLVTTFLEEFSARREAEACCYVAAAVIMLLL